MKSGKVVLLNRNGIPRSKGAPAGMSSVIPAAVPLVTHRPAIPVGLAIITENREIGASEVKPKQIVQRPGYEFTLERDPVRLKHIQHLRGIWRILVE